MVGMLGSRGTDNTLSGLINVVSDPNKFKQAMSDLQEATHKHQKAREAAAKQKAEAEKTIKSVNERLAYLEDIDAKVTATQKQLNDARNALATMQAAHDQRVADFNAGMAASKADYAAKAAAVKSELDSRKADLDRQAKDQAESAKKANAAAKGRRTELEHYATRLSARASQLDAREADVAKLEGDVRARVKKINELFPVG